MTHIKYLLNCKKFISLMILFSFFDNFGMKKTGYEDGENEDKEYNNSYEDENEKIPELNVSFFGEMDVGKTCIVSQLMNGKFDKSYTPTVVMDYYDKEVTKDNQTIKVRCWDCSGNKFYRSIAIQNYSISPFIVLVYSVTDKNSFNNLGGWLEDVKNKNSNARFLLVGNKIDCAEDEREVTNEDGRNFANEHNMEFFEVSAKKGTNISDGFFTSLIKKFLEEEKKKKDFLSTGSKRDVPSISLKSSFCDECCSCCPCFKSSEDNL